VTERKLAAILSADVVGYSRLMAEDEDATVRILTAYREQIATLIREHRGRVVDSPGDNLLAEFPTATDAVQGAVEIQAILKVRNAPLPADRRMEFRIGVHLGEVRAEGDRLYGDGVNIAARLEGLAEAGGICISRTVHEQVQHKLELAYEDLGEKEVKNIPEPIRAYQVRPETGAATPKAESRTSRSALLAVGLVVLLGVAGVLLWSFPTTTPSITSTNERFTVPGFGGAPAIAVLPFDNLSGDPEQEYFADGIAEDLITRLSAWGSFPVISRNSSFTYKGQAVDMKEVGRELGARYVVEGSVRKATTRVRISAQLIDTAADHHVWAETYDRELHDIFTLQDEITESIIGSIVPELRRTEMERAARRGPTEFGAYDLVMRATWHAFKATPQDNAKCRSLSEEAIELDPSYALAWASLANSHWMDLVTQWTDSPAESLAELKRAARKSVALDASMARSHRALAQFYQLTAQTEEQIAALEQAVSLDPSWSGAHRDLGAALALRMRSPEEALGHLDQALRLDPKAPNKWITLIYVSLAHLSAGRYERALDYARQAARLTPGGDLVHRMLAVSYVGLGRLGEARAAIDEALRLNPDLTLAVVSEEYRRVNMHPDLSTRWLDDLRKAGLPEG
jgi:adenylate cyclase